MGLFRRSNPLVPLRGVHLDLKGCPPTPQRLNELLKVIAAARYNLVLVEWEDQFPWTVDPRFRNETAYTPGQVRTFHEIAASLRIEVVPLVQCLGHMETPLSLPEYTGLREVPDRADGLNPLAAGARELVERMVDDVLALQPSPRYFHLGGDEAWTFGTHPETRAYIELHGKGDLYLQHVEPLLDRLMQRGVRPILWHDMMLHWADDALRRLAGKADLMVWGYWGKPAETGSIHAVKSFEKLRAAGISLWGGCAYKGADGHNLDLPVYANRQANTLGFADVAGQFELRGVVATGWSRYSTGRVQNEPIDAALDSLVNCGVILHDGEPPAGGRDACLLHLADLGERDRFDRCFAALQQLADARKAGWLAVQHLREQLAMQKLDPRRWGHHHEEFRTALADALQRGDAAATGARAAFEGLISPVWLERYLGERLQPLRDELAALAG